MVGVGGGGGDAAAVKVLDVTAEMSWAVVGDGAVEVAVAAEILRFLLLW